MIFYTVYESALGSLYMTSDGIYLTGLWMRKPAEVCVYRDDLPVFDEVRRWLDEYFQGNPPGISSLPLSPAGTPFQKQVWEILKTIPYGETTTYGAIAKKISPTMSAQAVGQAVGKNPISIIIPCHRCLGTNKKLTGYAGGLDKKEWLLRHEEVLK